MTNTSAANEANTYPVLPLRDIVVFPHMIVPLFVGREKSIRALEEVMGSTSRSCWPRRSMPAMTIRRRMRFNEVGTVANVLQLLKLPDGTVKVLIEGRARAKVEAYTAREDYYEARARVSPSRQRRGRDRGPVALGGLGVRELRQAEQEDLSGGRRRREPDRGLLEAGRYRCLASLHQDHRKAGNAGNGERQDASEKALGFMEGEISVLQVEKRIRSRVKRQMEKTQREYYLNEQMKAIQKELGDGEDGRDEMAELEERIAKTKLSKEAKEKADAELKKLRHMSPMSAEATVVRNYLDWLLGLPWGKKSKVKIDLNAAEKTLDEDHFGLDKVKERIVEYLAVQAPRRSLKARSCASSALRASARPRLPSRSPRRPAANTCAWRSVASVTKPKSVGHRRTYIGSMPGKIVQSMKKAKKSNPLFLLDEIDKMGMDFRGDPSSAARGARSGTELDLHGPLSRSGI